MFQYGVIYVDVLVCLNIFVDYFLLLLTSRFMGIAIRNKRIVPAALAGGLFSLYIFLPSPQIVSVLVQIAAVMLMVLTAYGFKDKALFLKASVCFFLMSFCLSGVMFLIWNIFSIPGLILNNGIFYFDISPVILIVSTVICYAIIRFVYFIIGKNRTSLDFYKIRIEKNGKYCDIIAKTDTGNALVEPFSNIPVIVADINLLRPILNDDDFKFYSSHKLSGAETYSSIALKQRVIPFSTVSGEGILFAFKADCVIINGMKKDAYIGVCANGEFKGEIKALVNPNLL